MKKTSSSQPAKSKTLSIKHTPKKKPSKKTDYQFFDEYRDLFKNRTTPISTAGMDRLCKEVVEWATKDEKALIVRDFFIERAIPYRTVLRWMDRYQPLKDAIKEAVLIIGSRREKGALTRKLDANTFFRTAVNYSPDFVETARWAADIKKQTEGVTDKELLHEIVSKMLKKFPDSDKVPDKSVPDRSVPDRSVPDRSEK